MWPKNNKRPDTVLHNLSLDIVYQDLSYCDRQFLAKRNVNAYSSQN